MKKLYILLLILVAPLSLACASIPLEDIFEAVTSDSADLDRDTVVAGLREALEIGTQRSIDRTSVVDGFLGNALIRIAIPNDLEDMADALRKIGLERQVDELEVGMNRAAEEAAGEVREIFWNQIRSLSFLDAMGILRAGETAATGFLQQRTSVEIRSKFQPIVVSTMGEVGLARLYRNLADSYNQLPFVSKPAIDLEDYVTEEAMGGLFTILGEEEKRIREDPIARTTELLKRVFE